MYTNLYRQFRSLDNLESWSPEALAHHFQIPAKHFLQVAPDVLAVFHRYVSPEHAYLVRGSIFFIRQRIAVRGMPKIPFFPLGDRDPSLAWDAAEELVQCLQEGLVWVEEKVDGINIRVYEIDGQVRFATRFTLDGRGVKEGFEYGRIARSIAEARYPGVFDMVRQGEVPIFELISPRFTHLSLKAREEDLILIDVLRQHRFLTRAEKEEVARRYRLRLVPLRCRVAATRPRHRLRALLRSLEIEAELRGLEGYVIKGAIPGGDQVFLKLKSPHLRRMHPPWRDLSKRAVIHGVRRVRDRSTLEAFIDPSKALPEIQRELLGDQEADKCTRDHIATCYRLERQKMLPHLRARRRAAVLLAQGKFQNAKEVLAETSSEDTLLRHHLIDLLREEH